MFSFDNDSAIAERQMQAVIFSLTAFGYIDGDFASSEKDFIKLHIQKLVEQRARDAGLTDLALCREEVARWTAHYHEVLDGFDQSIQAYFQESVAEGESTQQFVLAKLKLHAFEHFRGFPPEIRAGLLGMVDALMHADGVVHASEQKFRDEFEALIGLPIELQDFDMELVAEGSVVIDAACELPLREANHPFLQSFEWNYAPDKATFLQQSALDIDLIQRFQAQLEAERAKGAGKLADSQDFSAFAGQEPFLDGHVYVVPPVAGKQYELLVLGDLHGCYSCLKAALLQADFFEKVQAYHRDPDNNPFMMVVFLGDYIDRGKFSYNGILRTVMQLYLAAPGHVLVLRGNHEYYVEYNGRVLAPVRPSEAMSSLEAIAPVELFASWMKMFEALPNMLVFGKTLFVHAGIPRDDTLEAKYKGLASLNDSELRFQMLWSDPSSEAVIPRELQKATARFSFGTRQFKEFMARLGCTTMIRGHERIVSGFKMLVEEPEAVLLSLFSCGGKNNGDLPEKSNYRQVTPMALTIRYEDGANMLTPFAIDYEKFNDPSSNAFFAVGTAKG